MGRLKDALIDAGERGWHKVEKNVCPRCVEDRYLRKLIKSALTSTCCDYCRRSSRKPVAASVNVVLDAVYGAANTYFNEPSDAGVPVDGGEYLIEPWSFREVLDELGFDGHSDLLEDIVDAEANDAGWVKAANGHWASSHEHDLLVASWNDFSNTVKHITRFHFAGMAPSTASGHGDIEVSELLPVLADQLRPALATLRTGTIVYRARVRDPKDTWNPTKQEMEAPPADIARAGRMNPAGIPYLYTSFDRDTAIDEVGRPKYKRSAVFVASFKLSRDLRVIDLTQAKVRPSIFDIAHKNNREKALFIQAFVHAISKPVRKDGKEHVDYVPSQVVCEYLAQVFEPRPGRRLGGLIFPSSVREGGRNLVVFPSEERWVRGFYGVDFVRAIRERKRQ